LIVQMEFFQPTSLPEALDILSRHQPTILAGGTDVFPALRTPDLQGPVLDISRLKELTHIERRDGHWHFGAGVTWTALINTSLPPAFDALKQAATEVGSKQIQNRATIIGNLCNASPAADGVPPLLVLDAEIILRSADAERILALEDFLKGNRRTSRKPDEIAVALRIPESATAGLSHFRKLGARRYLVISITMAAIRLMFESETATQCAISIGACSEVARRLRRLEQTIIGRSRAELASGKASIGPEALDGLAPIDDVRATAAYRRESAAMLVAHLLQEAAAA
jgi:CO/xanthine dehydrogenase FAD-binding subunit